MTPFAETLKSWRKARRLSQLDLALDAGVSARHLSFLETARARPSRAMIDRLGDALNVPLAARNTMLLQSGFAARYPSRDWNADAMAPVRSAVTHMLTAHDPFPALTIDADWTVLRMNGPARLLFSPLGMTEGGSLLDLMLSGSMPALVENWPEVAHHAARRLRTESLARGGVPRLDTAAATLAAVPGGDGASDGPVVPTVLRVGPARLALFATIAQFGTPDDLLLDDLRIEFYFPADAATDDALRAMWKPHASDTA